jgi:hypothetical protein
LSEADLEGSTVIGLFSRLSIQNQNPKSDHLITVSARAKTLGGIVRPICLAVLRLINNSNFFDCSAAEFTGFLLGGLSTENAVNRPVPQMD